MEAELVESRHALAAAMASYERDRLETVAQHENQLLEAKKALQAQHVGPRLLFSSLNGVCISTTDLSICCAFQDAIVQHIEIELAAAKQQATELIIENQHLVTHVNEVKEDARKAMLTRHDEYTAELNNLKVGFIKYNHLALYNM